MKSMILNNMEKRIWKYQLEVVDVQNISMPKGAEILTIQVQYGEPCLWALVDPKEEVEKRTIEIFGTGNPILVDMEMRKYITTFNLLDGGLVFHVFENMCS